MLQRPLGGKRLFDCEFTAAWKKIPTCAVCGTEFSVNHRLKNTRRPLVLDCTHNACEYCIFGNRTGHILCKVCEKSNPIDRNRPIREKYEFNYYLMGLINYIEFYLQKDLSHPSLAKENESLSNQNECSECSGYTNHLCLQCNVPYCKKCFTNVHKSGRALQKHSLIFQETKTFVPDRDYKARCIIHKKDYDSFCTTCDALICGICITLTHEDHEITSLNIENQNFIPKLNGLIETVKLAKNLNRDAQKEIRSFEKTFEDYASETIEEVTKFFTLMHSTFQILEKKILIDIKKQATAPLRQAQNALNTFMKSYESLEDINQYLQCVLDHPPNCLLSKVFERITTKLEETACNVELEQIENNPFSFNVLKDSVSEIERLISLTSRTRPFKIKIMSFYGDPSCSETSEEKNISLNLSGANKKNKRAKSVKSDALLNDTVFLDQSLTPSQYSSLNCLASPQEVHVSHIKSPSHFFVQNQMFLSNMDDFKISCADEASNGSVPDSIEVNENYLIYNTPDKGWYRGKVIGVTTRKTYKVFLIDYGNIIQARQERFRELGTLKSTPNGAIECCIYGLNPTKGSWTDEASQLMAELIKNHMVTLIVVKKQDSQYLVDLVTTNSKYPVSLRDALLYTNLAEISTSVDFDIEDKLAIADKLKNNLIPIPSEKFYRNAFKDSDTFRIIITNIINPHEFYAIKCDHKNALDIMQKELNEEYEENKEKVFAPHTNMPCAVYVIGEWHRGKFIKGLGNGNSKVWLVDKGRHEIVNWAQIRVLDEKFLVSSEFAMHCSLVDIEPLQENYYNWTEEAINEFKRIAKNPTIQLRIIRCRNFRYKVVLAVIKKSADINVNALLVTYNHAIASGPEATTVKFHKKCLTNNVSEITPIVNASTPKSSSSGVGKTQIKINHIVSPGEFYVYLVDHINGIKQLHNEIQIEQARKIQPLEFRDDWKLHEDCLVYVSLQQDIQKQWYRAIIKDVDYSQDTKNYTVFLCDQGHTLYGITNLQLDEIDKSFSRICNGAILCHLACVQPTGGLDEWSYSSKDEFKNVTLTYEGFGATIQGKRKNNSIPIILWGMTTSNCDPFTPTICKWVNINKSLMNCGLAHMIEKFDPTLQTDDFIANELEEGQETIEQWIEDFNQRINESNIPTEFVTDNTVTDIDLTDEIIEAEMITWPPVRLITKTVFTAYPTYVDNQVIVYLHDALDHKLLEDMKVMIDSKMKDSKPVKDFYWYSGQACLARYHLDNKFYRAVVIEKKPNQLISVQFIDYGNIEECTADELRPQIMMKDIPTFANKYQIEGIVPKNQNVGWSTDTLDFIHNQLVGKLCSIRVSPNEENKTIKKCSIKVGNISIAELLWNSNRASKVEKHKGNFLKYETYQTSPKNRFKKTPIEEKYSSSNSSSEEMDMKFHTPSKCPEYKPMDADDFKKMFENKELQSLCKSFTIASNESDDDIVELEYSFQTGYWDEDQKKLGPESPNSSLYFNPTETSTVKSYVSEQKKFQIPKIPKGMTKFYCEVTYVANSTHLYISPFLTNFDSRFMEMSKQIQSVVKTCHNLSRFDKNTPCLAKYEADQLWYRAIIRSYQADIEKADLVFVDFMNAELVRKSMIKTCPDHILEYPLRNILVKLCGLKANPRLREADIQRKLLDILCEYKKVFVHIKNMARTPEVEIFSSQSATSVIYSEMIEQRYFLKD